jgi:hypothetical protein
VAWAGGLSFDAVGNAVLFHVKTNFPARRFRRRHQLADGLENGLNIFIVSGDPALEFREFLGQFPCSWPSSPAGGQRRA